jgi:diguanylate cyclase (GGDEF)-like protein
MGFPWKGAFMTSSVTKHRGPHRAVNDAMTSDDALRAEIALLRAENASLTAALADMEHVAQRDVLTTLFNRRYFLTALQQRIARVARYKERVAILYVDVDGLKTINDRLGHAAGDKVLAAIARALQDATRESDVVARIGGDEFALLIDHVDVAAARAKMAALRHTLTITECRFHGENLALSAAFGLSMIDPKDTAEDLLRRADNDMYRAKRSDDDIAGRPPGS